MNLSVCSFNVRGLGKKNKRNMIFNFLEKKKQFKVCFLRETHSNPETENIWRQDCRHHIYFCGRSSTIGGSCILLNRALDFTLVYHKEILPGIIQALKINIYDHDMIFLN